MWGRGIDIEHQCTKLFKEHCDSIGDSRREAKDQAIASGVRGFTEQAQKTGIHSFGTSNRYVSVWKELAKFAKEEKGVRDLADISNRTVKEFLHHKMKEDCNVYSSYRTVVSAVNKMNAALNRIEGVEKNWTNVTDKMREFGRHKLPTEKDIEKDLKDKGLAIGRGFIDAKEVVNNFDSTKPDLAFTAQVQYETGCRISEIAVIKENQLRGIGVDPYTAQEKGVVNVVGKGGKEREVYLDPQTYRKLEEKIENSDKKVIDKETKEEIKVIKVARTTYTNEVRDAAARAGQPYTGTHDFRHSWVQDRIKELVTEGYSKSEARVATSDEIGHVREYITETYLKA